VIAGVGPLQGENKSEGGKKGKKSDGEEGERGEGRRRIRRKECARSARGVKRGDSLEAPGDFGGGAEGAANTHGILDEQVGP
jgi:hypothetical protein